MTRTQTYLPAGNSCRFFSSLRRCFRREEGTAGDGQEDRDGRHRGEFFGAAAQAEPRSARAALAERGGSGFRGAGRQGALLYPRERLSARTATQPVGSLAWERGEERHAPSRRAAFKFVV